MLKVLKVFISFSIIIFLIDLLAVYAFLPDPVGIVFSKDGMILNAIARNTFFYLFGGVFILLQFIFYIFGNLVLNSETGLFHKSGIKTWFRVMFLAVNLFFILIILFYGLANNAVDYSYNSIFILAVTGPAILVLWLLLFPVFYFKKIRNGR